MDKIVLDTNLFFNMQAGLGFGKTTREILFNLRKAALSLKNKSKAEFYMPPSIVKEFLDFFKDNNNDLALAKKFISVINIKSPDVLNLSLSAKAFYKLIVEIRKRSYEGLKISEDIVWEASKMNFNVNDKEKFQKEVGILINRLRERYRNATRHKFLDSVADLDLIILAYELKGLLVSSDEGVILWGRYFGVKELKPELLKEHLSSLLDSHSE